MSYINEVSEVIEQLPDIPVTESIKRTVDDELGLSDEFLDTVTEEPFDLNDYLPETAAITESVQRVSDEILHHKQLTIQTMQYQVGLQSVIVGLLVVLIVAVIVSRR